MTLVLRWVLGIGALLGLAVYVLISVVGKGIASSYRSGSAGENLERLAATVGIPLLLALMLVSVVQPAWRPVLHLTAVCAAAALAGCLLLGRTNPGEASVYGSFLVLWLIFYATQVFHRRHG